MTIQKVAEKLSKILLFCSVLSFISLMLVVILQIITRLYLPITISWTEEVSRYLFLYSIAFAAPVVLNNRELVFVDILVMNLSANVQVYLLIMTDILIFILSICIAKVSVTYAQLGFGQLSPALQIPMWIPHLSILILSLFLTFFSGVTIYRHIGILMPKKY